MKLPQLRKQFVFSGLKVICCITVFCLVFGLTNVLLFQSAVIPLDESYKHLLMPTKKGNRVNTPSEGHWHKGICILCSLRPGAIISTVNRNEVLIVTEKFYKDKKLKKSEITMGFKELNIDQLLRNAFRSTLHFFLILCLRYLDNCLWDTALRQNNLGMETVGDNLKTLDGI